MEAGIASAIISSVTMIIVTYIGVTQKKNQKISEKQEAFKTEGALIQMEMVQAELKLSKVTAKAVLNQKCNGDVEEAMSWAQRVEIKYADYMRRVSQMMVS